MPADAFVAVDASKHPGYGPFAVSTIVLASVLESFMAAGIPMALNFAAA